MEEAVIIEIQPELTASIGSETENSESQTEANTSIGIETEIRESQTEANTSIENKSQYGWLVGALDKMIKRQGPSFSFICRIKRIPNRLRKVNEEAYTPMVISIGPLHHSNENLRAMEKFKVMYLNCFMERAKINLSNLVSKIMEMGECIYRCYAEASLDMDTEVLLKIILVDAIFILELFIRHFYGYWESEDQLIEDQMPCIRSDLVLLENQLPFFVLEKLFDLIYPKLSKSSLIDLTIDFFESGNDKKITPKNVKIEHFTDLIRIFQLPQTQNLPRRQCGSEMVPFLYSATQLHEAGVKFQVNSSKCLLDITFDSKNGLLEMPRLDLYAETEAFIRNVMAFEQYCLGEKTYIRDYYLFLDCLVNTTRDVDFLCDKGIIRNYMGDNKAATSLVNKLNIHVAWSGVHPNHNRIFKELNEFCEKPWRKWKVTLKNLYFNPPWSWRIASTIAAIILLVFAFIQTVCSVIQVVPIV